MSERKQKHIIWAAVLGMLFLQIAQFFVLQQHFEGKLLAAVTSFDEAHPSETADLLYELYTAAPERVQTQQGKQIMERAGYTKTGLFYFMREFSMPLVLLESIGVIAVFGGILIVADQRQKRKDEQILQQLTVQVERLSNENKKISYYEKRENSLKSFIENIAHQIKTPLTRLSMSLDLLEDDIVEDIKDDIKDDISRVSNPQNSDAMARIERCRAQEAEIRRLTNGLIQIGRMEAGAIVFHRDAFCMKDLAQDCASSIQKKKKVTIQCVPEDSEAVWNGSYEWTREAINNLLVNCAEHDTTEQPIEMTISDEKDYVRLVIRDHGPGFSPNDIPYLFDRFYRPERMKAGHVGIGMNLTKLIIEGQNGTITAQNHEQGGAEFLICLPKFTTLR